MLTILTINVFSRLIATSKMKKIDWFQELYILGVGFYVSMLIYIGLKILFL
jgi:hypothetical protein